MCLSTWLRTNTYKRMKEIYRNRQILPRRLWRNCTERVGVVYCKLESMSVSNTLDLSICVPYMEIINYPGTANIFANSALAGTGCGNSLSNKKHLCAHQHTYARSHVIVFHDVCSTLYHIGARDRSITPKLTPTPAPTAPSCVDNSWRSISTTLPTADSASSNQTLPFQNEKEWVLE